MTQIHNRITVAGVIFPILLSIIGCIWFIFTIEKRVSLVEQQVNLLNTQMQISNDLQDKSFLRFQDSTDAKLSRMEEKIEKIYTIISKQG